MLCWMLLVPALHGAELPRTVQQTLDSLVENGLSIRAFPGATLAVGNRERVLYEQTYGYHDYDTQSAVTTEDLFDIASCSKVFSTTFALMRLYDQGKISPEQTLGQWLPELAELPVGKLTLQELMTHTSGLRQQVFYNRLIHARAGERLFSNTRSDKYPYRVDQTLYMARDVELDPSFLSRTPRPGYRALGPELFVNPAVDTLILNRIARGYNPQRRGRYSYNDSNFYLLRLVAERAGGQPLETLSAALYRELGCTHTGYRPLEWAPAERIMPTEVDYLLRRGRVQGYVHDELAALSNGVGGNAGVFSNAGDLARFCQMIANGGVYDGKRIISEQAIDRFTASPLKARGIYRGLGFDKRSPKSALGGETRCGHTGFTGCIFWIDRTRGYYLVFLSNSVHPTRTNKKLTSSGLRTKLWQTISAYFEQAH